MLKPLIHDLNPSQAGLPKLIEGGGGPTHLYADSMLLPLIQSGFSHVFSAYSEPIEIAWQYHLQGVPGNMTIARRF